MDKVRNFFRTGKRQKLTAAAVLAVLYSAAAIGIFSFFHGSDSMTNRFKSGSGSLLIIEHEWDAQGEKMAASSEPGMMIPKDPCVYNNGQADEYILMKMTIEFDEYSGELESEADTDSGEVGIPSNEKRMRDIAGAIMLNKDTALFNDTSKDLEEWSCNNSNYAFRPLSTSLDGNKLELLFYYTAGDNNGEFPVLRILSQDEKTPELFNYIKLPVYKRMWLGVFDQPYSIDIEVKGIPAEAFNGAVCVDDDIDVKFGVQ
ncbi:MAG: hypothetical protein K5979_10625 [Ruminococcus sp.]|nr:hypothetical protein [Ruminococcus sp.]